MSLSLHLRNSLKDCPNFLSVVTPGVLKITNLLKSEGHEIRMAGGAVRDLLSGKLPSDIDFATTATPNEMLKLFEFHSIRTINQLGLKHGTVTARLNESDENFEITTLRIDTKPDGRRTEVEFTKDWKLDANRRDLTVNSMFLGLDGTIYDYFGGRKDLENKRICFVGNAAYRIREDYLRIFRYYRFYGKIADHNDNHDEETLKQIAENKEGIKNISGERIWVEWKKILAGNLGGDLTLMMVQRAGLTTLIGLPENPNCERFSKVWESSKDNSGKSILQPASLLSAFTENSEEWMTLRDRLKLSNYERDMGLFLINNREIPDTNSDNEMKPWEWKLVENNPNKIKVSDCRSFIIEALLMRNRKDLAAEFRDWKMPVFPVDGKLLIAKGCPKGPIMSGILFELKDMWKRSDYKLTQEELYEKLPDVIDKLQDQYPSKSKKAKRSKNNSVSST